MESMTDWAFSWPISAQRSSQFGAFLLSRSGKGKRREGGHGRYYVDNSLIRSVRGFDRCYELFGRTWSRG